MELSELSKVVKDTLTSVSKGVEEAQKELKSSDTIINPSLIADEFYIDKSKKGRRYVSKVEFNIEVKNEEKSRGMKNIKFAIPVALPTHTLKKEKTGASISRVELI